MCPLGLLSLGEKGEVIETKKVQNFRPHKGKGSIRLEDMGLRAGKTVEILNNEGRGPLLVKVENARLAIGRKMAMKIMVRRCES